MSKVICDVCGTSYPETSTQCPICGYVRPADAAAVADEGAAHAAGTYQYVKGGRFSKSNVRKRNAGKQAPARNSAEKSAKSKPNTKSKGKKDSGNTGLVITIFVLLLAILAVIGYIIVKFFIPASADKDPVADTPAAVVQEDTPAADLDVYCEDITLDSIEFVINEIGGQVSLNAELSPADTTEEIVYSSYDEAVATVDDAGTVTAVGYGETVITVSCGAVSVQCNVSVEEPFVLDTDAIRFDALGAFETIYSGTLPFDEITWTTDDDKVAVVADGVVTSVGSGSTTVYGTYRDQTLSCSVICSVAEEGTEPEATNAAANVAPGPYKLKNLYSSNNSDVSLSVGESFPLELRDANGNKVEGVTWSVENGKCCTVKDGFVKAVSSGYAEVVATYNGETFKCIVRVR